MKDSVSRLSPVTILLHWLVGLAVIALLGMGLYMSQADAYSWYPLHKSIGALIVAVVLARIVWRFMNRWPQPLKRHHPALHSMACLMPVSGLLMSIAGGHGLAVFGATLAGLGHEIHEILPTVLIAALVLHIGAALKHWSLDRDATLERMLGRSVQPE